jgi:RNA polymerase sigma factor (sigma-70 family)
VNNKIEHIWERVCEGDEKAWETLVSRYKALVYTVAMRTGLSEADAEDCAQQTWLSLYRRRDAIENPERLPVWIIKTAKRRAMRMMQQKNRYSRERREAKTVREETLPDEELAALERQTHIEHALQQLDERCRKLLTALFFAPKDKSYQEIAQELGINPNSLGPVRSRCLHKLKRILLDLGYL